MALEPDFYRLKIVHGKFTHEIDVPNSATFGDIKKQMEEETQLKPDEQIILFRGKKFPDDEKIQMAGITNRTKLNLEENTALIEKRTLERSNQVKSNSQIKKNQSSPHFSENVSGRKTNEYQNLADQNLYFLEEKNIRTNDLRSEQISKTMNEINSIKNEVEKYSVQVKEFEESCRKKKTFEKKIYNILNEVLERFVLKLDCLEVNAEERMERKKLVKRIQSLNSDLDKIKMDAENAGIISQQ